MDTKEKRFLKIFGIFVLIGAGLFLYLSMPFDEEVQLLPNATVDNLVNGKIVKISDVKLSGTAMIVPFDEYKVRFESNAKAAIIAAADTHELEIYYITKINDKTFATSKRYLHPLHQYPSVDLRENIRLHYERSWWTALFWMFISGLFSFLLTISIAKGEETK